MAALFDGTAAYLKNTAAPIAGYPFSVGCWFCPTAASVSGVIFGLSDTATTNNNFSVRRENVGDVLSITTQGGGSTILTSTATSDPVNRWAFILARFISATNRRLSVLHSDGSIENIQNTTSATPTGIDTVTLGAILTTTASRFFTGLIGEFWWTNTDIQADAGQIDGNLMRQLAWHGPFSVPHVAKDLIEYQGMRSSLPTIRSPAESFFGGLGIQTWADAATTLLGWHPPLPYEYDRPQPVARMLMI